jgi:putative hydrolase of the HAD superfamily
MALLKSAVDPEHEIRNIIFDFGGVICDIDMKRSEMAFKELGFAGFNPSYSVQEHEDVFRLLEGGKISAPEFTGILKKHLRPGVTDAEVIAAWNAMILNIPSHRITILENVRTDYRIFVLSNSNEIHHQKYLGEFKDMRGYSAFEDLFEKTWFSYRLHLQKPSREIFEFVLNDAGLNASQTLFIDDSIQHVTAAGTVGLRTYHLAPPADISGLFE